MKINDILGLVVWTPISDIFKENMSPVIDGIYQVGSNLYLRTQRYNRNLEGGDPRAPFVVVAYWSPSLEGLKRVVFSDPCFHLSDSEVSLPPEISLGTEGKYSELVKKIGSAEEKIAERATYSNKGEFVKRVISIGRFSYCFANNEDMDERAFAIEIALLK